MRKNLKIKKNRIKTPKYPKTPEKRAGNPNFRTYPKTYGKKGGKPQLPVSHARTRGNTFGHVTSDQGR